MTTTNHAARAAALQAALQRASDDHERLVALLRAAGLWDAAPAKRRLVARALLRVGSVDDLLTWLVHRLLLGQAPAALATALDRDPGTITRAVGAGAVPQVAGRVWWRRHAACAELVQVVAEARHAWTPEERAAQARQAAAWWTHDRVAR